MQTQVPCLLYGVPKRLDGSRCHNWHEGRRHCATYGDQAPPKGHSPQFSAHVYCGQTVARLISARPTAEHLLPVIKLLWYRPRPRLTVVTSLLWPPCIADADVIFSSCGFLWPPYEIGGHYIFALWLLSFFLSFYLSIFFFLA